MNTSHNSTDVFAPIDEGAETEFAAAPVKTGRSLRKPVLLGAAAVVVALVAGGGVAMAATRTSP